MWVEHRPVVEFFARRREGGRTERETESMEAGEMMKLRWRVTELRRGSVHQMRGFHSLLLKCVRHNQCRNSAMRQKWNALMEEFTRHTWVQLIRTLLVYIAQRLGINKLVWCTWAHHRNEFIPKAWCRTTRIHCNKKRDNEHWCPGSSAWAKHTASQHSPQCWRIRTLLASAEPKQGNSCGNT